MQKMSETVYASLFWVISGLLVWLILLPLALICVPFILVRIVLQALFNQSQLNFSEDDFQPQISSQRQPINPVESVASSLLLGTIIGIPGFLASVISLQPRRFLQGEPVLSQLIDPQPVTSRESNSKVELSAEEKPGGT